jgi:hypothetical protein
MNITYAYEIISVDEAARCMEVVYSAEGHQTMHIGARLPFEGESLESVIKAFAPVQLWVSLAAPVVVPPVGLIGTIAPEPEPETSPELNLWTHPTQPAGEIPVSEV